MKGSRTALQLDRPANVLDGDLVLAHLVSNYAEKMPRIGMIRFSLQNLPVELLGSLQPTGLMVLYRNRQGFGNRCHSVNCGRNYFQSSVRKGDAGRPALLTRLHGGLLAQA